MAAYPELDDTVAGDADDELRALMSAMLSNPRQEKRHLRHIAALCRTRPACVSKLRKLVDRYYLLGRMPAAQHQRVTARIDQALVAPAASAASARTPDPPPEAPPLAKAATPPEATRPEATRPKATRFEATRSEAIPPATPATSIGVGRVLRERYELQALLARGRLGAVYRALDRHRVSLGFEQCQVALKILASPQPHPAGTAALGREFRDAQGLSHPGVIQVYDIDHDGEAWFYSMELLEGLLLSELLQRLDGPLPRRYALAIVRDVGAAIAHAHARGIVHADLRPHHIMLTGDGQVRVMGFGSLSGVAREPRISEFSPADHARQATPAYASCEQLEGWPAEPLDDTYALACIAYELFAGKHPFDQRPALDARAKRLHARRPPGLRVESWRALRRGLAWTREKRPQDIAPWLRSLGVDDAAPDLLPLSQLVAARPPRIWLRRITAAVLILVGLGLCAFAFELRDGGDWRRGLAAGQSALHAAGERLRTLADEAGVTNRVANSAAATSAAPNPAPTESAAPATRSNSGPAAATGAARIAFAAPNYTVRDGEPAARIVIRRLGGTDGDLSFVWWTEPASARPDVDYASLGRRTERIPSGTDKITVYVPIISNSLRTRATQFYVALREPAASKSVAAARASVIIDHSARAAAGSP